MSIFGIWGFDFLYFYIGVVVAARFLAQWLISVLRPRGQELTREPLLYEKVGVCHGARYLVHAVVARFVQEQRLTITDDGKLAPGPNPEPEESSAARSGLAPHAPSLDAGHALEDRILEMVEARPSSIKALLWGSGKASRALVASLEHAGLRAPESARARSIILKWVVILLVLAFGLTKVWLGYWQGDGVLILIPVVFLAALFLAGTISIPLNTRRGDQLARELASKHRALIDQLGENPETLSPQELALGVGVFGAPLLGGELGRALASSS